MRATVIRVSRPVPAPPADPPPAGPPPAGRRRAPSTTGRAGIDLRALADVAGLVDRADRDVALVAGQGVGLGRPGGLRRRRVGERRRAGEVGRLDRRVRGDDLVVVRGSAAAVVAGRVEAERVVRSPRGRVGRRGRGAVRVVVAGLLRVVAERGPLGLAARQVRQVPLEQVALASDVGDPPVVGERRRREQPAARSPSGSRRRRGRGAVVGVQQAEPGAGDDLVRGTPIRPRWRCSRRRGTGSRR